MESRHRTRPAFREEGKCRHRLDQHLWLYRRAVAVGRRARFRLRPRTRLGGDREFHRAEGGVDEPQRVSKRLTRDSPGDAQHRPVTRGLAARLTIRVSRHLTTWRLKNSVMISASD